MRAQLLFRDPRLRVTRYDHPSSVRHRDPAIEEAENFAVSFVESGSFGVHRGKDAWRLSRASVFVTRPGLRYRCTHESEMPDDVCLSLDITAEAAAEAEETAHRAWDSAVPMVQMTNRLAYLHHRLIGALSGGSAPMAVPSLAADVLAEVLGPGPGPRLHHDRQLAWYAERIDAARDIMERRFADPLTLDALGREVGISPFHLSRIFHGLVGMPPHRYLVKVRLARAADALLGGATVTAAARQAGFPNLGNFIRRFRQAYGVSPSRYGREPRTRRSPGPSPAIRPPTSPK